MAKFIKLEGKVNGWCEPVWVDMDTVKHMEQHHGRTYLYTGYTQQDHVYDVTETPDEILALIKEAE